MNEPVFEEFLDIDEFDIEETAYQFLSEITPCSPPDALIRSINTYGRVNMAS